MQDIERTIRIQGKRVAALVAGKLNLINTGATIVSIHADVIDDDVVTGARINDVGTQTTVDGIRTITTRNLIGTVTAINRVVSGPTFNGDVTFPNNPDNVTAVGSCDGYGTVGIRRNGEVFIIKLQRLNAANIVDALRCSRSKIGNGQNTSIHGNREVRSIPSKDGRIRARAARDGVVSRITREQVVAGSTGNDIITGTAFDDVIACAARENVGIVLAKYGYRDTADDRNIIDASRTRQNEAVRISGYANIAIVKAKRLDVRDRVDIRRRHMGDGDRLAVD